MLTFGLDLHGLVNLGNTKECEPLVSQSDP